jgi:hypothetical protein
MYPYWFIEIIQYGSWGGVFGITEEEMKTTLLSKLYRGIMGK